MKKILLVLLFFHLDNQLVKGQIVLENIVDSLDIGYTFYTTQLSDTETKYVLIDNANNTFSLYNMDFSPFLLSIAVPEPFANTFQPIYITRSLFDCDSTNIEYAYESTTSTNKPFRIMRTDGTVLFQLDSANGPFCVGGCLGLSDVIKPIRKTSSGTKMYLQKYYGGYQHIYIYSLCGLLTESYEFNLFSKSYVAIFPNPSTEKLTFRINLPDNVSEHEIIIYGANGNEIKRQKIDSNINEFTIETASMANGLYFYSLISGNKPTQAGKFVITK